MYMMDSDDSNDRTLSFLVLAMNVRSQIWQGSHGAAHPVWANDQKFQCVLTIADPRLPNKKLAWLDDDEEIDHLRVEAEVSVV